MTQLVGLGVGMSGHRSRMMLSYRKARGESQLGQRCCMRGRGQMPPITSAILPLRGWSGPLGLPKTMASLSRGIRGCLGLSPSPGKGCCQLRLQGQRVLLLMSPLSVQWIESPGSSQTGNTQAASPGSRAPGFL